MIAGIRAVRSDAGPNTWHFLEGTVLVRLVSCWLRMPSRATPLARPGRDGFKTRLVIGPETGMSTAGHEVMRRHQRHTTRTRHRISFRVAARFTRAGPLATGSSGSIPLLPIGQAVPPRNREAGHGVPGALKFSSSFCYRRPRRLWAITHHPYIGRWARLTQPVGHDFVRVLARCGCEVVQRPRRTAETRGG